MAMGGAYIRHRCYEAMGSMFTIEVSVRKDHKLITHGPYGVVRHPSYTGTFLAAPGGMLWHFTRGSFFRESTTWVAKPLGVVAFAILISAFFILPFRIKKEDELMKEQFGDEWEEWAKKVPNEDKNGKTGQESPILPAICVLDYGIFDYGADPVAASPTVSCTTFSAIQSREDVESPSSCYISTTKALVTLRPGTAILTSITTSFQGLFLRRYQLPIDHSNKPSKGKDGKRRKRSAHMNGQELIHYYNMETCELEVRPLARVYGVANLYRDVKNIKNANDLEEQLSRLENDSASVVKTIHDSLGRREFQIKRKALESLRKFLFIMFYRKAALASSYYDENNPENAPLAEWVRHVKKNNALNSREEVWLYFLRFFLATPHQDLISRAEMAMKNHGIAVIFPSNLPESAMNEYATFDYASIASALFLGIVEAADGKEFVMSDNSFGLFVVSPRVALLLRRNECRAEFLGSTFVNSDLIDIQIEPPQVEYLGEKAGLSPEELTKHRASPNAQNDVYHFRIVKLTTKQTQQLNDVVLLNVKEKGSVTFLTRATMLKTLQDYRKTKDAILFTSSNLQNSYSAFMTKLETDDQPKEVQSSVKAKHSNYLEGDISKKTVISPLTISLDELRLCSDYNQAYQRYSTASVDEPLVETLSEIDGAVVLGKMKGLLAKVDVQRWDDATTSEELFEAAIVGLLEWLVKNKGDVLKTLFPNIVLTES
ncbi:hypothetical protein JOM56_010900 [Amanita muscaria]